MKKFVLVLLVCFWISNVAFASSDCKQDCHSQCPQKEKDIVYGAISADDGSDYRICTSYTSADAYTDMRKNNAVIGWGKSCSIPAGEHDPSQYSCISAGNVFGQVIDTFTTAGIAIAMRENFCSFAPGNQSLEGVIVKKTIFTDNCNATLKPKQAANCVKCILRGKLPNDAGDGCSPPCDGSNSDTCKDLNVDGYLSSKDNGETDYLCNGIPNLERPLKDSSGNQVYDTNGIPVYCPMMRCNIPTNDIWAKYYDDVNTRTAIMGALGGGVGAIVSEAYGSCCDIKKLHAGDQKGVALWQTVWLKGSNQGDRICVKMYFPGEWRTVACKEKIEPERKFPEPACFVKYTPVGKYGKGQSRWMLPITSVFIQTVTETFDALFTGEYKGSEVCQTGLTTFQKNMSGITFLALVLYFIILGFRIANGSFKLTKRNLFVVIGNVVLVNFFCFGYFWAGDDNGLIWLREISQAAIESFSSIMMEASAGISSTAGASGLCDFSNISYAEGFSYLKMWDTLDCKIFSYLGLNIPTSSGYAAAQSGTNFMSSVASGIFNMLWSLIFSGSLFLIVFLLALWVFLVSLLVYMANFFVVAMIAVIIMIFFGPIMVPMALFSETKGYFDSWLRTIIGYTIQPIVVTAVIALMLATFDTVIYSDCKFQQVCLSGSSSQDCTDPYWIFDSTSTQSEYCQESYGYILANLTSGKFLKQDQTTGDTGKMMYTYNTISHDDDSMKKLLESLMMVTFFAFLFYYFAEQIDSFVMELTGVASLGMMAMSPNAITDLAIDVATRGRFAKAKQAMKQGDTQNKNNSGVNVSGQNKTSRSGINVSGSSNPSSSGVSISGSKPSSSSGVSVSGNRSLRPNINVPKK